MLSNLFRAAFAALSQDRASASATPEAKQRMGMVLLMMGADNKITVVDSFVDDLEAIAANHSTSFEKVEEIASAIAEELEPRIQAVLPLLGLKFRPKNEKLARRYIHTGNDDERRMRMAYVEEKAIAFSKDLPRMFEKTRMVRELQNKLKFLPKSQRHLIDDVIENSRGLYCQEEAADIWMHGPEQAAQEYETFLDYFNTYEISYTERLRVRARTKRLEDRSSKPEKIRSTSRRMRQIDEAQKTRSTKQDGIVFVPPETAPSETLASLREQAENEYAALEANTATRLTEFLSLQKDIAGLNDEMKLERELAAEYEAKILAAIAERRAIAECIAELDRTAFIDDQAEELAAFAPMKLNEAVAGVSVNDESAAPPVTAENKDIAQYLNSSDPHIRAEAYAIAQLREKTLPLEVEWTQLCSRIDQMSFQRTYIQKMTEQHQKRVVQYDILLTDLMIQQAQLEFLMQDLMDGNGHETVKAEDYPADLKSLSQWANEKFKGKLIITKSALRSAAESQYQKPAHVYAALELLGNEFWTQKNTGGDQTTVDSARTAFMDGVNRLHLSQGGSLTDMSYKHAKHYMVNHEGRSHFLDMHLCRGVSRDPRHRMRIYYTWDAKSNAVVIGHLPGHLSNSLN